MEENSDKFAVAKSWPVTLIVSRHPATVALLKSLYPNALHVQHANEMILQEHSCVAGNLPLWLASKVSFIVAVEFLDGSARNRELSDVSQATLTRYVVTRFTKLRSWMAA